MQNLINIFLILITSLISNELIKLFNTKLREKFIEFPNSRSMHTMPTPTGAGIIFVLLTALSSLIYILIHGYSLKYIIPILCIPLAFISFLDDIYKVRPILRYFFHILTSGTIIYASFTFLENRFEYVFLDIFCFILLTFICTAIINFVNFMDGIDGIVGGGLFVSIFTCCMVLEIGQPYLITLSSLFVFIIWNWNPAKIFMGDTGSTFLAAINIGLISMSNNLSETFGLILIITPYLVDPFVCVLRRYLYNQNIFEAHRLHLYQRLTQSGIKGSYVSLIYILSTTLLSIIYLSYGVLPTFIFSVMLIIIGFYLDQNLAISFESSIKKINTK